MFQRRHLLPLGAAALAAPALAAPRIAQATSQRVLKFVPQSDLTVLDPVWTTATVTRNHAFLVFDTLYGLDTDFRPHPQMAEGHVVEADGRAWNIRLRPGLMFHDGTPVLARDCVASLQRWGRRDAFGQSLMAVTEALEAPDDRTIRFRLKRPFPLLVHALAKSTATVPVIMPERLAKTDAFTQVPEIVGSGPYRFLPAERLTGARVVYEKFAGYRPRENGEPSWTSGPKQAHFERVEWNILPDAATAAAALQSGEVDWWESLSPDLAPMLRRDRNLRFQPQDPTGSIGILRFNHLQPPFDNPAIRRAVLGAVSQADYMSAVAGSDTSLWRTGVGVFTPGTPMATDAGMEVLNAPRDMEKVKRDLAAAGYKGEKVVVLGVSDLAVLKAETDVGADMFQRMGMNVDFQAADWGTVVTRRANKGPASQGGWNVHYTGFNGIDFVNPVGHLPLRGNGDGAWFGWPGSPRLEELRDAWMFSEGLEQQKTIAVEMQRQAWQDVPYIPLGQYFVLQGYRRDLAGMLPAFPVFWNVRRSA